MPNRHPAFRLVGGLVSLAAVLGSAAVLLSFGGEYVPALDSVGHFRLHLGAVLVPIALAALVLRRPLGALVALVGAGVGLVATLPFALPRPTDADGAASYTLLQMNLRYDAPDPTQALRLLAELRPDIVTLEEVTDAWRASLSTLEGAYPYQAYCGVYGRGGSAILSRRPFVEDGVSLCRLYDGFTARTVDFNGRRLTVVALHLDWPWPRWQWTQVRSLEPILGKLPGPGILGGDFNSAPWSASVNTLARAAGWSVVRGIGPTFLPATWSPWIPVRLGLPLDNVLVSPGVSVREATALPPTSSDHLPVLVRFAIDAPPADPPTATVALDRRERMNGN